MRARRGARDCFTGQAARREVTVGAAPVASLGQLQAAIRARIGAKCQGIESIVDLFVVEVCRNWPERHMASLAKNKMAPGTGEPALDALCVIAAKCREQIEARWEPTPNTAAALNLLLQAVVVEFANLWFSSVQQRIALRAIITRARTLTT
jgi:hypothetical protein